jgi:hypothetical protein
MSENFCELTKFIGVLKKDLTNLSGIKTSPIFAYYAKQMIDKRLFC